MAMDILMSLHEEWAKVFLDGTKRIEFRRRRPNFPQGTIVWMYATVPRRAVIGWFETDKIIEIDVVNPPAEILAAGAETPESIAEYIQDLDVAYGIEVVHHGRMIRDVPVPGNRGPMSYRIRQATGARHAPMSCRAPVWRCGLARDPAEFGRRR